MSDLNPEIRAAAKWWADTLRQPVHHDNGEVDQSAYATAAANEEPRPTPHQADQFERLLARELQRRWDEGRTRSWAMLKVSVDYHAPKFLCRCLTDAGFPDFNDMLVFPIKTCMWIEKGRVRVSCGYGARSQVIFPE